MAILSLSPLSFLSYFFLTIILFTSQAKADYTFCDTGNNRGTYLTGSTYHNNLKIALIYLTFNSKVDYGFYNINYGQDTAQNTNNRVYVIGLCRGDVNHGDCRKCLVTANHNLIQTCPNQKEAIGWYDSEKCMLRYSDRSILGLNEMWPAYYMVNVNNAASADQFNIVVKQLLNDLRSKAINGDTHHKYVVGTLPGPSSGQTIYGLVQCTPDLTSQQCDDCLVQSISDVSRYCSNRIGARMIRPSCSLRYELYQF